jgi:NADPH:quinone reductase
VRFCLAGSGEPCDGSTDMRAVICRSYGPPENLVVDDLAEPVPGPGQLVVHVRAAAVNFPDLLLIAGKYQVKIPVPFTPGSELAGEVVAAGVGAPFRPGDRVFGTIPTGAFAELALLDAHAVSAIPDNTDFAAAAAFGVTYRTAYHALRSVAQVSEGDWVVILGAAGGVGQAALDLAVAMKARVLAAASTEEKLDICRQRGAEATTNYERADLKSSIRELTGGEARVVIDPVGGPYAEQALRGLARGGIFVTLGYAAGAVPAIPLNLVLLKDITIRGMEIRTFTDDHPDDAAHDMRELQQMFIDGRIRPYIGARFSLSDTATALRYVAERKAVGKVIIDLTT